MLNLLHWEHEQLLEHLSSREDIWTPLEVEGRWLRTDEEDNALLGLVIYPPTKPGPYRQYTLNTLSIGWDQPTCDAYLEVLCDKWTTYGQRKRYAEFLTTEVGLDPGKARAAAIGLCRIDELPLSDPERTAPPSNRELWPDLLLSEFAHVSYERTMRSFGITGGGWLTVHVANGMLRVRTHLPADGRYGGGYSCPFEGYVRPTDGNLARAEVMLFGNTYTQGENRDDTRGGLDTPVPNSNNLLDGGSQPGLPGGDASIPEGGEDPPQPIPGPALP